MATDTSAFATIEQAIEDIRKGRMVVVVDDEDRENEGDLTLAADFVTPEAINFMARFGRGLICLTLTEDRADLMRLGPMTSENTSRFGTAFTESIEAREGVTTGISAADRAHTIKVAIDPASTAQDLARPGHVFPLRARDGGVLVRAGQTEASVDLARMAGLTPAGIICEVMNEDGSMARVPDLKIFCQEHGLLMVTVADLIRFRLAHERYTRRIAEADLTNEFGTFRMIAYENDLGKGVQGDPDSHVALVLGDVTSPEPCLVRVHTFSLAEDVFGVANPAPGGMIAASMRLIAREGRGAVIYLHNGRRGFGIDRSQEPHRILSRDNQSTANVREDASHRILRQVGLGGQIMADLGIRKIRLITNQSITVPALQGFGIEIVEQVTPAGERLG